MGECTCEKLDTLDAIIEKAYEVMEFAAPLTTKQRKKMKTGTFCGPNRSFPIPDCKHVAVAKTYLARAKFSEATKKRIASCINGKAKALKCDVTKKAKASDGTLPRFIELSAEEKKLYSSDIFESTRQMVEESIKNPGMELMWDESND